MAKEQRLKKAHEELLKQMLADAPASKKAKIKKDIERVYADMEHFERTGVPRCFHCSKNYKKVAAHVWKPTCKCTPNLRLCVG